VPEWDPNSDEDSREDAAWRELVARFDSPLSAQEPVPWPEREAIPPAGPPPAPARSAATPVSVGPTVPETRARSADSNHYVPPPPPPLPKLDTLSKLAWLCLFGGPGYLLVATAAQWSMPGLFVFIAVAAFVTGVALLVFKLNDSDRDDSDDDGAVV
jgi:hypothetical protein